FILYYFYEKILYFFFFFFFFSLKPPVVKKIFDQHFTQKRAPNQTRDKSPDMFWGPQLGSPGPYTRGGVPEEHPAPVRLTNYRAPQLVCQKNDPFRQGIFLLTMELDFSFFFRFFFKFLGRPFEDSKSQKTEDSYYNANFNGNCDLLAFWAHEDSICEPKNAIFGVHLLSSKLAPGLDHFF
ncbi:MAG: hypothetical protein VXY56_08400, partial [Pseudomonadota bacterium]|nr:hypothetical protein [Pseudomonadota bacterium]